MKKIKKLLIICYIVISVISFGISAIAIEYYSIFKNSVSNRADYEKTCELDLVYEGELECDWVNSPRLTGSFADDYKTADFNSDLFWCSISSQEDYDFYKEEYNLPDFQLPPENKQYIVSLGRKIDSFYIARVVMYNGSYPDSFFDKYRIVCNIWERPQYRGIAKYDTDYYVEDKIFIYSADEMILFNESVFDLPQLFW